MAYNQLRNFEGGNQTLSSIKTLLNASNDVSVGTAGYYMTDSGSGWTIAQLIKAGVIRYIWLCNGQQMTFSISEDNGTTWTDNSLHYGPKHLIALYESYITGVYYYFPIWHEPDPSFDKILRFDFTVNNSIDAHSTWHYVFAVGTPTSWGGALQFNHQVIKQDNGAYATCNYLTNASVVY